jgi:hypothetical protein
MPHAKTHRRRPQCIKVRRGSDRGVGGQFRADVRVRHFGSTDARPKAVSAIAFVRYVKQNAEVMACNHIPPRRLKQRRRTFTLGQTSPFRSACFRACNGSRVHSRFRNRSGGSSRARARRRIHEMPTRLTTTPSRELHLDHRRSNDPNAAPRMTDPSSAQQKSMTQSPQSRT